MVTEQAYCVGSCPLLVEHRLTSDRTTVEKDNLGREHMKLSFHVSFSTLSKTESVLTLLAAGRRTVELWYRARAFA